MSRIDRIEDVPLTTLAYLTGRWIAIAQIQCNAATGYGYTIELHALAAAAVYHMVSRGASSDHVALSCAVDALGEMIRSSFPGGQTDAYYPPTPRVIAEIVRQSNDHLTA